MEDIVKILILIFAIVALVAVVALIRSEYERHHFVVKRYTFKENVKEKCTFMLISDLHNAEFGHRNEKLLKAIDDEKPDFICIAGDMLVGSATADNKIAAEFVTDLAKKYKVYYGAGNHENRMKTRIEEYGDAYERYLKQIYECGTDIKENLTFLENSSIDYEKSNIRISGLDIDQSYYNKIKRKGMQSEYLDYSLGVCREDKYNILIAHHPRFMEAYAKYGANLVLAGHYHGGTVRLPWVGGCIATDFRMLPKYEKGVFIKDNTKMIVSGGLGTHTINVRLFNKPELIKVELLPKK